MEGSSDFNCDFNAPMFVDFTALDQEADHADAEAYFEVNHEHNDGGIPSEFEDNPAPSAAPSDQTTEEQEKPQEKRPKNIVTSWSTSSGSVRQVAAGAAGGASSGQTTDNDTPTRKALRKAVSDTIREITNSPKLKIPDKDKVGKGSPVKRLNAGKPLPLPNKKPVGASSTLERKPSVKQPIPVVEKKASTSAVGGSKGPGSSPALSKWRKAIQQMTPEIMRQARSKRIQKTESAVQADQVSIKAQLSKVKSAGTVPSLTRPHVASSTLTRPTAASSGKAVKAAATSSSVQGPFKATQPQGPSAKPLGPTEPVPFNFATSKRNQQKEPVKAGADSDIDFAKMLRSYQQHNNQRGTPVCTEVQPFNLTAGGRSRSASRDRMGTPSSSRSSSNERGITPARKRFRSASPQPSPASWRPTQAQTPHLVTRGRARGPDPSVVSHEEREEVEVRGRQPFRANPVPPRVLGPKPMGLPHVQPAKPVIPESPAFALKQRMESRKRRPDAEQEPEPKRIIYAKPVPSRSGVPVILPSMSKKATKVAPFSFDSRDAGLMERREQKIQALAEEERRLREFKANPVPTGGSGGALPEVPVREATRPQPFDLEIEKRVGERLTKWEEAVEEDLKRQREAANFRAKPAAILEREPFRPKHSDKSLACPDDFQLHSDRRAAERQHFDEKMRQREAEQEAMKKRVEQLREMEREEEVRQMRRDAVHKAQPIKQYKPIHIVPSDRPITDARSPNWSHKHKAKDQ